MTSKFSVSLLENGNSKTSQHFATQANTFSKFNVYKCIKSSVLFCPLLSFPVLYFRIEAFVYHTFLKMFRTKTRKRKKKRKLTLKITVPKY